MSIVLFAFSAVNFVDFVRIHTLFLIDIKRHKSALALGVLENVRDTLVKTINKAMTDTNTHRVLIVGGVASNGIIRNGLTKKLDGNVYFAKAEYSTDNAVGTAYLAHLAHKEA